MNTVQWTCKACITPNILIYDDTKEGHVTLNCNECGHPASFSPRTCTVEQFIETEALLSTHSTHPVMATVQHTQKARLVSLLKGIYD